MRRLSRPETVARNSGIKPGARPTAASADPALVGAEIARLDPLDLAALRVQFRNRTGRIAPARISRPLLLRVLAYRIQAEVFGDLRPETRRMLDRVAAGTKDAESRGRGVESAGPTAASPTFDRPRIGTVLVREWRGRMQHVMVLADGFAWNGTTFASLSAVAHAITGTKWNGRRFFGLDRPADEQPPLGSDPKSDRPSGRMICRSSALARPVASSSRGVGPLGSRAAP